MTTCHDFRPLRRVICPVCSAPTRDITSSGRTRTGGDGRRGDVGSSTPCPTDGTSNDPEGFSVVVMEDPSGSWTAGAGGGFGFAAPRTADGTPEIIRFFPAGGPEPL